ncbi:MAG: DUF5009 domain-containing protein [Clostridium sp.]|nr:DUF5009 domain-containing protein [Clostridium sp.]
MKTHNATISARLHSLDALRGMDMFFIMGGGLIVYGLATCFPTPLMETLARQMNHAPWGEGFRFEDLIFPLFLFIAGISFPFSLAAQRSKGTSDGRIARKVVKRGLTLVVLGVVYNGLLSLDFATLRYASVLGRIGLAWMLGALVWMRCGWRTATVTAATLLLGYWALLALVPAPDAQGADAFTPQGNIACYVDRLLLPGTLHGGNYDPEGLLSTLPAVSTALLGMLTGWFVKDNLRISDTRKCLLMGGSGLALLAVGTVWNTVFPINKYLWTSSFVCVSGGWSLMLFALFHYIIDVRGWRRWSYVFTVIGLNSITIYLAQEFIDFRHTSLALFGGLQRLMPENTRLLVYALGYTFTCWLLLYMLHRLRIYLKV